jgi:diguanylate cyclase (GGDEF)-like protein
MPGPTDPAIVSADHPNGDLQRQLLGLLGRSSRDGSRLDAELRELAKSYPGRVYQELIQHLTSLELNREEGAGYWKAVVAHQGKMEGQLGRAVDVRVAMLDWLLEARALKQPRIVELAMFQQLQASVHRDALTGLHNFRFFEEHLRREIAKHSRRVIPLSLAMIDIDHFKSYNDRYGHEAGNRALIAVGRVLTHSLRQHDICARYGGEEFALVLSDTTKPAAKEVAERTRQSVELRCQEISGMSLAKVPTVSIGIATYPADATDAGDLVRNADKALYTAKARGRNQVRVYGDVMRSFRRSDMRIEGRLRMLRDDYEPFQTSSVGEGGLSMHVGRELPIGALVEVALSVPDRGRDVRVTGRVVHSREAGPGEFETGVDITDIDEQDRAILGRVLKRNGDPAEMRR